MPDTLILDNSSRPKIIAVIISILIYSFLFGAILIINLFFKNIDVIFKPGISILN